MIKPQIIHHWITISCMFLWCHTANALTVTTWNLQWLSSQSAATLAIPPRTQDDYSQLSAVFFNLNADVLAFQEVNDRLAIKQVVGDDYLIVFSDREKSSNTEYQFSDINQYTGFAIKKFLKYRNPQDVILTNRAKLRFASYIIIYPEHKAPVHLLNVHLKTGCFAKDHPEKQACIVLKQQAGELNHWLKQRDKRGDSYMITGDFNHNLSYTNDWLWHILTKDLRQRPTLTTQHTHNRCVIVNPQNHQQETKYKWLIDHTIASADLDVDDAEQITYPHHWITTYRLSDHCPLSTTFN